ncbi:MAG: 23S rRNA (pseudouridine(1915)-N(3))-methyltransferase RlmH [Patescibacteria group bacterium]
MHLHLIVVGKLKEEYWREAEKEYLKRLKSSNELVIHEIKEESFTEKDPVGMIKEKEGKKILETLGKIRDSLVVALEEKGKQFDSEGFAKNLSNWAGLSHSVTFIIGGPLGLSREVVAKANMTMSLSPLTFTHQMARVILLEQIYRAMMIASNRKYHY